MKRSVIAMVLLFALILSGCGSDSNSCRCGCEGNPPTSTMDPVSPTVPAEKDNHPDQSSSNTPDVVESDIPQPAEDIDRWIVTTYINETPFTPDNYHGQVIDYVTDHISSEGTITQVTYKGVAFISYDDESYDEKYGDYKSYYMTQELSSEEEVQGYILRTTERFDFLEHYHDGTVDRFLLDIDLPSDRHAYFSDLWDSQCGVYILAQNDSKVIMRGGPTLFTYDFETAKTNLISDSVLDYKYPVEGELFFTDWDHAEHAVDWENNDTITETGNKVFSYPNEDFELVIMDDFEEEFLALQEALRKGEVTEETQSANYNICYSGSVFKASDGEYIGNIHLPEPYVGNSNLICPDIYSCWQIEESLLILYRSGIAVRDFELPAGRWKILQTNMSLPRDPTTSEVRYVLDSNNDGRITAKELDAAIISFDVLLMNVDEASVYLLNQDGDLKQVLTDVVDYREVYGKLYWMDSNGNAYQYDWFNSKTNILIGKNAVGIAPFADEGAGFLVKPDGSQDYFLREGWPLGVDWLS